MRIFVSFAATLLLTFAVYAQDITTYELTPMDNLECPLHIFSSFDSLELNGEILKKEWSSRAKNIETLSACEVVSTLATYNQRLKLYNDSEKSFRDLIILNAIGEGGSWVKTFPLKSNDKIHCNFLIKETGNLYLNGRNLYFAHNLGDRKSSNDEKQSCNALVEKAIQKGSITINYVETSFDFQLKRN